MFDDLAGVLSEIDDGYSFAYFKEYLENKSNLPVSQTLPIAEQIYTSNILFPCFDGLILEGWLLEIAVKNWKLNPRDRMGLLLSCCKDCIGAVSVIPVEDV